MKKILIIVMILLCLSSPLYAMSNLLVTLGEATNSNKYYKSKVLSYFQSKINKNIKDAKICVITASEVNEVSKNITGKIYAPSQIYSCALVDLSYNQGIKVEVDKSKINIVTPEMYANALESTGIDKGYVVVTSPVPATGESALAGVLKSYEVAVGVPIPEPAKKLSVEELNLQNKISNETNQSGEKIAALFKEVKNQVREQNIQNPEEVKTIIRNVANNMGINISQSQVNNMSNLITESQKLQNTLQNFKQKLNEIAGTQGSGILDQIYKLLQEFVNIIQNIFNSLQNMGR